MLTAPLVAAYTPDFLGRSRPVSTRSIQPFIVRIPPAQFQAKFDRMGALSRNCALETALSVPRRPLVLVRVPHV